MGIEIALAILKKYWLPILLGVALLSTLGYTKIVKLERDHYKSEYKTETTKYTDLVNSSKAKEQLLQDGNKVITDKYANILRTANDLVTINARLNEENINNAKELRDVKLSLVAIRLFNASKQSTTQAPEPANTVQGTDGTTSTTQVPTLNLQDMLKVVNYNDANHLVCIKTVETWQKFWIDFVNNVKAANAE